MIHGSRRGDAARRSARDARDARDARRARHGRGRLRAAVVTVGAVLQVAVAVGCSGGERGGEVRRPDPDPSSVRRNAGRQVVDTTSLVTPVRVDSLIGVARGAGGTAMLRTTCASCHEGVHGAALGRDSTAAVTCNACHATSHAAIESLYAGTLPHVALRADTMYLARVSCAGCHVDSTFAASPGTARVAALETMCVGCHGTRFRGMLASWQEGLAWRAQAVAAYVRQASSDARLSSPRARARVLAARQTLEVLRLAGAVHNVRGADGLFRTALASAAAAYAMAGMGAPPLPLLGPDPSRSACLGCHYGVEASTSTVRDETFQHASHVIRGRLACRECHSDAAYFTAPAAGADSSARTLDPRHGRTTLTTASCTGCHHSATAQLPCATCHAADTRLARPVRVVMALALQPEKAPRSRPVAFQHAEHARSTCESCHATPGNARNVASCSSCHTDHHRERAVGCVACHGTTMLATHTMDAHFQCASCHVRETVARLSGDRPFCLSCHVKQVTHEPARECAPCHLHLSPAQVRQRILATPAPRSAPK